MKIFEIFYIIAVILWILFLLFVAFILCWKPSAKREWEREKEREKEREREAREREVRGISGFSKLKMGSSYQEVIEIIGFEGLLFSSKTGKGIEIRSKNMICLNCGATYNTADDLICSSCGALNIKDIAMLKDNFVQEEYVWYLNDNKTKSIKCIFKNDKLISKVQQGLY